MSDKWEEILHILVQVSWDTELFKSWELYSEDDLEIATHSDTGVATACSLFRAPKRDLYEFTEFY